MERPGTPLAILVGAEKNSHMGVWRKIEVHFTCILRLARLLVLRGNDWRFTEDWVHFVWGRPLL